MLLEKSPLKFNIFLVTFTSPWRIKKIQGLMVGFEYAAFHGDGQSCLTPSPAVMKFHEKSIPSTFCLTFPNFGSPQKRKTSNKHSSFWSSAEAKKNQHPRICQYYSYNKRRGNFWRLSMITHPLIRHYSSAQPFMSEGSVWEHLASMT